eukprot:4614989-Prymnesium_polylepis.1
MTGDEAAEDYLEAARDYWREGHWSDALTESRMSIAAYGAASPNGYHLQARSLHKLRRLPESGASYLRAMQQGLALDEPAHGVEFEEYQSLLDDIRRSREYFSPRFDGAQREVNKGNPPEPPELRAVLPSTSHAITLKWRPRENRPKDGGENHLRRIAQFEEGAQEDGAVRLLPILKFTLELAEYDVSYRPSEGTFAESFGAFNTVRREKADMRTVLQEGLRPMGQYKARVKLHNAVGESGWSNVVLVDTPPVWHGVARGRAIPPSWRAKIQKSDLFPTLVDVVEKRRKATQAREQSPAARQSLARRSSRA